MPQRKVVYQQLGAIAGIAAPIVAFPSILIAIAFYPTFSWSNNALSDLGIIPGITGTVFNFGIYTSGLLSLSFAIFCLFYYLGKTWAGKIGSAFFAMANLSLTAIGFFNESFSPTHYLVSVAFFALVPISLFILTLAFWLNHQRSMAGFTVLIGVLAALPWLLWFTFNYVSNVAIPESLSGVAVSVWVVILAQKNVRLQSTS